MSAPPVILFIDTTNKRLISSFISGVQPFQTLALEAGDLVPMQLHFLTQNGANTIAGALPYSYVDPSTVTPVDLAIGIIGLQPTGGTFTVTWNAATTAALAYNISASALATAINGLSGIPSGGVTVVGNAGGPWTVTFVTAGTQSHELIIDASLLVPTSQGLTAIAIAGATNVKEQEVLSLVQSPAALQNTWTATYGAIAVSNIQVGTSALNAIQQIALPAGTYGGSFSLAFGSKNTVSLPYNATAAAIQTALQALSSIGANNVLVTATSTTTWTVTFTGTLGLAAQSLITANSTGLQSPMYLVGSLNLNVQGVFNILNEADSVSATLQIQQGTSGNINTVVQTAVTINNTLILGTPSVPNPANPWQTLSQVNALIAAQAAVVATTTTLGSVIVPTAGNLAVDGSGNISVPLATTSVFGVVKPNGTSITISSGIISTAQDIRSTASPTFAGLTLSGTLTGPGHIVMAAVNTAPYAIAMTAGTTTNPICGHLVNGTGDLEWGVEGSTPGDRFTGCSAYAGIIGTQTNNPLQFGVNGTIVATFAATGLNSCAIGATTPSTGVFTGITMGSGTGTVTAASGVFSVTSDKRAKNERGAFMIGLDAILALDPVLYDFKSDKKHLVRAGFYTQDVEKVIPEAVFHDSPDGLGSLDDRPIIAALVNAVKELTRRLTLLESR